MKTTEILILAGAAGFAWWLLKGRKQTTVPAIQINQKGAAGTGSALTTEILNNALPGQPGWGWKYYTDGTAIGPDGTYYKNGEQVWTP